MAELERRICSACHETKAKHAFATTGDASEDLTVCRGCRGAAKRKANRERVAAERDATYHALGQTEQARRPLIDVAATVRADTVRMEQQAASAGMVRFSDLYPRAASTPAPSATTPTPPVNVLPPALRAVLRYVPASGTWTSDERFRFMTAFAAALDLEVKIAG